MENNENEKTRKKLDILIWKHDICFLNFLRNKKLAILVTFQNINNLSTLKPRTKYSVHFSSTNSHRNFWATAICSQKLKASSFNSFLSKLGLIPRRNILVWRYCYCPANHYSKVTGFIKSFKGGYRQWWLCINSLL